MASMAIGRLAASLAARRVAVAARAVPLSRRLATDASAEASKANPRARKIVLATSITAAVVVAAPIFAGVFFLLNRKKPSWAKSLAGSPWYAKTTRPLGTDPNADPPVALAGGGGGGAGAGTASSSSSYASAQVATLQFNRFGLAKYDAPGCSLKGPVRWHYEDEKAATSGASLDRPTAFTIEFVVPGFGEERRFNVDGVAVEGGGVECGPRVSASGRTRVWFLDGGAEFRQQVAQ